MNKPILSDEQLLKADLVLVKSDWKCPTPEVRLRQAAQAQRDADLKWLCEEVEKSNGAVTRIPAYIHYSDSYVYMVGVRDGRDSVLALLRGDKEEEQ